MALFKQIKSPKGIKIDPRFEKLPLKSLFVISFFVNSSLIILGLLSKLVLPPEIPLFYGLPKNSQQLSQSIFIILPSLISLILTLANSVISINLDSQFLKRSLAFASILVTLLSLITTYKIIFLVGSI